jgi:hypothetical protein
MARAALKAAKVLAAVARGELDLNRLAREELAARGLDDKGIWRHRSDKSQRCVVCWKCLPVGQKEDYNLGLVTSDML